MLNAETILNAREAERLVGRVVRLRRTVWSKTLRLGEGERARVLTANRDEGTLTIEGIREGKLVLGDRRIVRGVKVADVEVVGRVRSLYRCNPDDGGGDD